MNTPIPMNVLMIDDHVMFLQNFGVLDSKLVHDSMHRIAREVMPEVLRRTAR